MRRSSLVWMLALSLVASVCSSAVAGPDESVLRLGTFDVDATPPIGSPVAYAPVRSIVDRLHARGLVLLPAKQLPMVLVAVDWIGIGNGGQDEWRSALAVAAGTDPGRVAVHTLHQHDGAHFAPSACRLVNDDKLAASKVDLAWSRQIITRVADAVAQARGDTRPVTHVATGRAAVHQVASNRRLLGADGRVAHVRWSRCTDPKLRAMPEGLIDPDLRLVTFWNGNRALACLAYYATHPMSYYGQGDVSADFVGLARAARDRATGVPHIYFTGAAGNVAAGKYNDGSPPMRQILADRMADAMRRAWESSRKQPLTANTVHWSTCSVTLPVAAHLDSDKLRQIIADPQAKADQRWAAARNLAWTQRQQTGHSIDLQCLRIAHVAIVHMPGELFIEYQLLAQKMCPNDFVCMAAYGDYGPGYIGTEVAYSQGGYETSQRASRVAPGVEKVLTDGLRRLLLGPVSTRPASGPK